MRISLIIPTFNAGPYIENLLSMLSAQDTKPWELIIVDSSSEDSTVEIAKRFAAKTIVIPRQTFNHGKTRNLAAMEAKGNILVFMTQDAFPYRNTLLSTLTAPLQMLDIAASYGRHIPKVDASPLEIFARRFNYPDSPMTKSMDDIRRYGIKTFFFSNACSAIKRDIFLRAGMFREGVRANEDMLMAARLILSGHKVAYVPDATVIHSHNYSLVQQFRRYYDIGSSLKNNAWVLDYARPEGEGLRFIREQLMFVVKQHGYLWIPYIFLESLAKYMGYRAGLIAG
ncbi:MAG TPA: glycosyltransferase [Thermodesulfovibrionales bacterium]|nr:glycosyltransferase [Thermodesulfovibrionales bacterium]